MYEKRIQPNTCNENKGSDHPPTTMTSRFAILSSDIDSVSTEHTLKLVKKSWADTIDEEEETENGFTTVSYKNKQVNKGNKLQNKTCNGKIVFVNKNNWGMIERIDTFEQVFFSPQEFKNFKKGMKVKFELGSNNKGICAKNVLVI